MPLSPPFSISISESLDCPCMVSTIFAFVITLVGALCQYPSKTVTLALGTLFWLFPVAKLSLRLLSNLWFHVLSALLINILYIW